MRARPAVTSPRAWSSDGCRAGDLGVRLGVDRAVAAARLASLMWHGLGLAAAVAAAVRARLGDARETELAAGLLSRFGFQALESDPRWCYLPKRDVETTVSTQATPRRHQIAEPTHPVVTGRRGPRPRDPESRLDNIRGGCIELRPTSIRRPVASVCGLVGVGCAPVDAR
jgi:hypothetical protein